METSIRVKFSPSRNEFGKGRVYFQIIRKRVVRQLNPNIKVPNSDWISDNEFPYTNNDEANDSIRNVTSLIRKCISFLDSSGKDYTAEDVVNMVNDERNNLIHYINMQSDRLRMSGKIKTSENYRSLSRKILEFVGNDYVTLQDIDGDFVESLEAYMLSKGLKRNTTSFYIRILRAIWNKAIDSGVLPPTLSDPFRHVYKGVDVTRKRAISLEDIKKLKKINLKAYPKLDFARDMFMFSFYTRGMSFIDIVCLKKDNIQNGILSYQRRKTGKMIHIKLEKCISSIIDKYSREDGEYIFPIATSRFNEYAKSRTYLEYVNKNLKEVAIHCDIESSLTMYVARHSWASIAHNEANIPISVISKGMGHSSEKVTEVYLASFGNKDIDNANNKILSSL